MLSEEASILARLASKGAVGHLHGLVQRLLLHDFVQNHSAFLIFLDDASVAIAGRRVDLPSRAGTFCAIFEALADVSDASDIRQLRTRLPVVDGRVHRLLRLDLPQTEHATTAIANPLLVDQVCFVCFCTLEYAVDLGRLSRHRERRL